jgi:hypothetical protein
VSHFGESYVYGPAAIDPAAATRPWARPADVSFALGHVLASTPFGAHADQRRIGALGHSSGGATVLQLGGAIFDPAAMHRYCASDAARRDRGYDYGRGAGPPAPAGDDAGSYRDQRVKAIVALDPALGPGHRAASLAAMTVPVHIVRAVANDFLPFESHAAWYARHIPGASLTPLTGGEGHFVFLNTCDAETRRQRCPALPRPPRGRPLPGLRPARRSHNGLLRPAPDARLSAPQTPAARRAAACQGLSAPRDRADPGGHSDDSVAGTDADGTGWPVNERTASGLAGGASDDGTGGAGGRPPARQCGDHSQDQSHDGEPDPGTQPGSGVRGGRHGAAATGGVTDWVSDPAGNEDRQTCDRQCAAATITPSHHLCPARAIPPGLGTAPERRVWSAL